MERNKRVSLEGIVVSDRMEKTIVVQVERKRRHPKYLKLVKYRSKFYVHDEKNEAKIGDTVLIMGCRPLSALKRFRLVKVTKKAFAPLKEAEAAEIALEAAAEKAADEKLQAVKEAAVVEEKKEEAASEEKPASAEAVKEEKEEAVKEEPTVRTVTDEVTGEEKEVIVK